MKIEFEIQDIDRGEVVDAMARQLLDRWSLDEDGNRYSSRSQLGEQLACAVENKIKEVADGLVREHFAAVIGDRITAAVDAVIAEGWYESDKYGGKRGERIDLKARINMALNETRGDSYNRKPSLLAERLDEAAKGMLDKEFKQVVEDAKAKLRQQLDGAVMAKVAASIKEALGLK